MRILVGTKEIAGMIPTFADGFRQLGHRVTTAIDVRNKFYPNLQYDVDIGPDLVPWSWKVNRAVQVSRLPGLIARNDLFVFQWGGSSFMSDNRDYPLLKKLKKRIVSLFCGDDVRHSSAYNQEFDSITLSLDHCHRLKTDPLSRPLRNLRMAEQYSDLIVAAPNVSGLAVRPYMHFLVPLNLSEYKSDIRDREEPVVVHAPSNKDVKGTHLIVPALERLRAEGVPFELRLLHDKTNQEVLAELANADVIVDQLHFPLHGKLGIEAMASGCALATGNREDYEPFPPNRPIWHVDSGNVYEQLKRLLTDKALRTRLAREGREYVRRYHDHVKVARRIIESLNAGKERPYDHYPTFYAKRFQLPAGVVISSDLQRMTAQIIQRWGLPEGVDPQDMIRRGLMSAEGLKSLQAIPRWNLPSLPAQATV